MKTTKSLIVFFLCFILSWLVISSIFAGIGVFFSGYNFKECLNVPPVIVISFFLAIAFGVIAGNDYDSLK
jgi:hypothetical protein